MIDAEMPDSKPTLITGSHNWTFTAETKNDENLLVIQDFGITNLYKRAMYYWWNQLTTNVKDILKNSIKATFENGMIEVEMEEAMNVGHFYIFDANAQMIDQGKFESNHLVKGPYYLPTNVYYLVIENKGKLFSQKIINL
jgi:hypothetical protein